MDAWRTAVVNEAKSWLRTKWEHHARVKGAGVDCAQFLIGTFVNAGLVADFDTGYYSSDWMMHQEEEQFLGWLDKYMVRTDTPRPGDVVIWKFGRCYSHGGIVIDWPTVIHAYAKERCVTWGDASKFELAHRAPLFYTLS